MTTIDVCDVHDRESRRPARPIAPRPGGARRRGCIDAIHPLDDVLRYGPYTDDRRRRWEAYRALVDPDRASVPLAEDGPEAGRYE